MNQRRLFNRFTEASAAFHFPLGVTYELSADVVGVATVERHSTNQQGQDRT